MSAFGPPSGRRWPSCSAGTASTGTPATSRRSPALSSSTREKPCAPHHGRGAARHEHADVAGQPPQRGEVEVVEVEVRDQHGVERPRDGGRRRRAVAAQVPEVIAQQRVGEQARAAELEQHGGVANPGEAIGGRAPDPRMAGRAAHRHRPGTAARLARPAAAARGRVPHRARHPGGARRAALPALHPDRLGLPDRPAGRGRAPPPDRRRALRRRDRRPHGPAPAAAVRADRARAHVGRARRGRVRGRAAGVAALRAGRDARRLRGDRGRDARVDRAQRGRARASARRAGAQLRPLPAVRGRRAGSRRAADRRRGRRRAPISPTP